MVLIFLALSQINARASALELHLVSAKRSQIVGEPADLRLFLVNKGSATVNVAAALQTYDHIQLEINKQWVECAIASRGTAGVPEVEWQQIKPAAQLSVALPGFYCPEDAGPISNGKDWREIAGDYRVRVEISYQAVPSYVTERAGPPPEGAFQGTISSDIVDIAVTQPLGVDAEALRWARENRHDPVSTQVASQFPTSRYAALLEWQYISIGSREPEYVKTFSEKGLYPDWRSVPDGSSAEGQRAVNAGKDMARWRVDEGERILREQKRFPYERGVRLSVGVSYAILGEKDKAKRILKALATEETTPEAEWAISYLTLQGWR
jgi:hypothetical protein